jgi:hypothetical protein
VRPVKADEKSVTFHVGPEEQAIICEVLAMYPVVPPAHHLVTKNLQDGQTSEYQHLLDEALAAQRASNKRHLEKWLATPNRFKPADDGFEFKLSRSDFEWLLRVLNDIRVGAWLLLGSPEETMERPRSRDPKVVRLWAAMQVGAYFQTLLLHEL